MSSRRRSDAKATENDHNQNSVLSAKVSRALEVRSDTPAMKAALDALAHLPDHQDDLFSVDSRSVRVAIEQDALQQALFLQEKLRGLLDTVSDLRNGVTEIAAIAHEVEDAVSMNVMADSKPPPSDSNSEAKENENAAANTAADIGLEAEQKLALTLSEAFVQRNMAKKRVEAVHAFLEKFDLSEEDSRLLDHYAFEDIETSAVNGMAFLAALERVRVIRLELGQKSRLSDADASRLGASSTLRMMEGLAMKQENAYERLYHWLQKYLRVFGNESAGPNALDEDVLDEALSNPFVLKSLRALKNVPAFHSHLLELIASSRRSEETRRFLIALTSGYQGLPPIEMRAHDAVVYVGDMLAFCFQAFSVEADVARGVLRTVADDDDDGDEGEVKTPLALDEADYLIEKPMTAAEMVIQSMGGVARPLKSRILQVIANLSRRQNDDYESDDDMEEIEEEGSGARHRLAQLYEICGLLLFYMSAIGKSISKLEDWEVSTEKNPLLDSLVECLEEGTQAYDASLRVYCSMFEQLNLLTGDSESLLAHAMIIKLADLRNTSPGFTTTVECPADCKQALSLDFACKILVEASLPSCKSLDDTVLLKQAIATANESELGEEITLSLRDKIEIRETSLINELVQKETSDVLDLCGLGSLLSALDRFNGVQVDGMVMSAHPGLAPEDVQVAMKEFYTSLYSPPIPSFESTIRDPSLRKSARKKIADSVCDSYKTLYDTMTTSERGGYDDLGFLSHTPEQVSTLFTL